MILEISKNTNKTKTYKPAFISIIPIKCWTSFYNVYFDMSKNVEKHSIIHSEYNTSNFETLTAKNIRYIVITDNNDNRINYEDITSFTITNCLMYDYMYIEITLERNNKDIIEIDLEDIKELQIY